MISIKMKILFAGGGTAGHINPAIAVAKYIKKKTPESEILFIGTGRGLEKELVPKAGFDIKYIDVLGFKRSMSPKNITAFAKVFGAYGQSVKIIREFKPDAVIGTGGYVSGPVLAAAVREKIPTLIHEQNVSPGFTSKILSGMVDVVCISFMQSKNSFKNAKQIVYTGNPLREELFAVSREKARKNLSINNQPFITAFGGSLGAHKINEALLEFIIQSKDKNDFQLLLATGGAQYDDVLEMFRQKGITKQNMPNIKIVSYIHNMAEVLCAADLVVARAGAITISEINALGKPSILIPSPNVTNNHQEYNARALETAGAAIVFTEDELKDGILSRTINELISDSESLTRMSKNSEKMGIKNGTQKIYNIIIRLVKKPHK